MIDRAVSIGRLGLCCRRLPVPPRMMAENGKVQKTVGLVLKSLRKSRSQGIIAETGKVRYHCVPKKESGHSTHLDVAWGGGNLTHSS